MSVLNTVKRHLKKVGGFLPEWLYENRGYLPGLVLAIAVWGGLLGFVYSIYGQEDLGQQFVNMATYISIGFGGFAIMIGAPKDVTKEKTAKALFWSIGGVLSYMVLAILIPALLFAGINIATGRPPAEIGEENFFVIIFGVGGLVVMYIWYKANVAFFRWVKSLDLAALAQEPFFSDRQDSQEVSSS